MKKSRVFAVILSCILALSVVSFAACGKTYTVTFDCAGGGTIESQTVKQDGKAIKPEKDPEKTGFVFNGWYLNDVPYSFDAAVTADITLVAKWKTAEYTVTFKSEGASDEVKKILHGNAAVKPKDPEREGFIFDGWYRGAERYDFSVPVSENIELVAKWLNESDLNAALAQALNADYTNYTSVRKVTEIEDKTEISYTITYKRTATAAHNVSEPKSAIDPERYVIYDDSGALLAGYYKDNGGNWAKSSLGSFEGIVLSMKTNQLSSEDFKYSNGKYEAYDESLVAVEYALFGTMQNIYRSIYAEIKDGKISALGGELANSTESSVITFYQTFSAIGTTQIEKPSGLPAATVEITAKDKTYTEGDEIEKSDLLALFTVKADGRTVAVTEDMIDFSELNLSSPAAVGTYALTLTYTDWNGESHSETATVTVNAKQAATATFAEIFAKDYTNATIELVGPAASTSVVYKRNGNLYFWTAGVTNNYAAVDSTIANGTTTLKRATHNTNTDTKSSYTTHTKIARIDLIFGLDASLFEDKGDGRFEFKPDANSVDRLKAIFKYCESMAASVIYTDEPETYPFSLTVTVSGDYISKIECSFYYKMSASSKTYTARSYTMTLSNVSETDAIDTSPVDDYLK
ncbi:MAG: hypothetical protein HFK08_07220 [Clostridia bacterium]|nr:hypothetical protein [Clostridia bacterium]